MSRYAGRVALITGGASGIGAALADEMARAGAEVVVADRQSELAAERAAHIRGEGGRAWSVELDVRDAARWREVVAEVEQRAGGVDYLFNNAGIGVAGAMEDYELADWDDVLDVNLRGVVYGVQAVYPRMIRQGSGHIVNTASMAGLLPMPSGSYTVSKFAVVGLSKALRVEGRRHGVRASVLCPGVIRTPILTGGRYGRVDRIPLGEADLLAMWQRFRPMDAHEHARKVLRAVDDDVAVITFPRWWRALWLLDRLAPSASLSLWTRFHERLVAELDAKLTGTRPRHP